MIETRDLQRCHQLRNFGSFEVQPAPLMIPASMKYPVVLIILAASTSAAVPMHTRVQWTPGFCALMSATAATPGYVHGIAPSNRTPRVTVRDAH